MLGTKACIKLLSAVVFGVAALAPLAGHAQEGLNVPAPLVFASGFETGAMTHWKNSGRMPIFQTAIRREGTYAIKSVIDRYDGLNATRSEVVAKDVLPPLQGEDVWYGFSVYLPASYVPDPGWEAVAQWHDIPDANEPSRNPIVALWSTNGRWTMWNLWDADPLTTVFTNAKGGKSYSYDGRRDYDLGAYETGKWTDFVVHMRWSWKNDGLMQVWKNGVLLVDQRNLPNCFNDAKMPYFKMGIYKGWSTRAGAATRRELYHDSFRMAVGPNASYKDVAPGSGATMKAPAAPTSVRVQ